MSGRLAGKKAIVTGASNGIGLAIARAFVREGADLLVTAYRHAEGAQQLAAEAAQQGRRVEWLQLACQDEDAVERLFAAADSTLGAADILVNNVGVVIKTSFLEHSREDYERSFQVNSRFPFFATQRFARTNIQRQAGGSVINIASVSAFKAISRLSSYQCSKAALAMLGKSAALELAPHGIRVNTLSPGLTATNGNAHQWRDQPALWRERSKELPLGRTGMPEDMAGAAVFLASEESSWMTGGHIVIDGGDSAI
ncbi:SDR family oxidoreductase [Massilia sp. MB5]|uniref:SDR family NAD(P)-dependent oxidoreductase n=1 Tax=Massilia sp. MB5 TaxID=2919578 RepID=UPI001F0EC3EF|nr:SDR family oxidoreductase [Massilia sp. MB5]UMR32890.1 SDR family oxidoreductase [Massilia sp. MB5]